MTDWKELKAHLLAEQTVRLTGVPADQYIERSKAGPGAGGSGSLFFSTESGRVRLLPDPESQNILIHHGNGRAKILRDGEITEGRLEKAALHCPREAYITVSEGCIFECLYCNVPEQKKHFKSTEEVVRLVESVIGDIDAISLTSGVIGSPEEDEARVCRIIGALRRYGKPIGVSIYPSEGTPERLRAIGVSEVKFNLEAATSELFSVICPGLDYALVWRALERSVDVFGRGKVFSNVILGLGETEDEMDACIRCLTALGVIPVIRPLSPTARLSHYRRPTADMILRVFETEKEALREAGLDPSEAETMCSACTGCDLVPEVDG